MASPHDQLPQLDTEHELVMGSLCTGYGGLDLGVLSAVGGGRIAWVADPDPHVAQILAVRMPGITNLGDLRRIDWAGVEPVDVVVVGFPCQDISAAGRRAGIEKGTRSGLWSDIVAGIRVLRPALVVVENVAALRWKGGGLHRVLGDLAEAGYDALWRSVRAADVGAAHRRERVFLLAWHRATSRADAADTTGTRRRPPRASGPGTAPGAGAPSQLARRRECMCHVAVRQSTASADSDGRGLSVRRDSDGAQVGASDPGGVCDADRLGAAAPDAACDRHRLGGPQSRQGVPAPAVTAGATAGRTESGTPAASARRGGGHDAAPSASAPAHVIDERRAGCRGRLRPLVAVPDVDARPTASSSQAVDWGVYEAAIQRWEQVLGRPAPYPTQSGNHQRRVLAPSFVEHLMGLPEGWVTDVGIPRAAQLRALGNGVVPQQAAHAVSLLLTDLAALLLSADQADFATPTKGNRRLRSVTAEAVREEDGCSPWSCRSGEPVAHSEPDVRAA